MDVERAHGGTITVTDGIATVEALSQGASTLTVTAGGLTAQAVVSVWASTAALPPVFEAWTLEEDLTPGAAPLRGDILRATLNPEVPPDAQPGLFFVDEGTQWGFTNGIPRLGRFCEPNALPACVWSSTRIRAVSLDGRELSEYRVTGRRVRHVAADQYGGVVLVREAGDDDNDDYVEGPFHYETVTKLDGRTGAVVWQRESTENYGHYGDVAIHPDGTVYFVEDLDYSPSMLWGVAGATGAATAWVLPSGQSEYGLVPAAAAGPIIDGDGVVQLVAGQWSGGSAAHEGRTMLVTLRPGDSGPQLRDVAGPSWYSSYEGLRDNQLLPDGHGSLLLGNRKSDSVSRLGPDLVLSNAVPLESRQPNDHKTRYEVEYALGDDGAYAVVNDYDGSLSAPYYRRNVLFDPVTLQRLWEEPQPARSSEFTHSRLAFTTAGGGVQLTSPAIELETQVAPGLWAYYSAAPTVWRAGVLGVANTQSPYVGGTTQRQNATTVWLNNKSSQSVVFKHESCQVGFGTLPAGDKWYSPVDGVKPNAWNGDWYKVLSCVGLGVETNGEPVKTLGLRRFVPDYLACAPDGTFDDALCNKFGGRKVEPGWSTVHPDWAYPARPRSEVCAPGAP